MRRAVSEFPNDNPELHDGLVWSAPVPCAPALPTLRLRAHAGLVPRVIAPSWAPPFALDALVGEPAGEPLRGERNAAELCEQPPPSPALAEPVIWEPVLVEAAIWEPETRGLALEFADSEPAAELPPPAAPTPFEAFVAALVRVALERGATRAAACLPGLFGLEPPTTEALDAATLEALRARGILEREGRRPTAEFSATASAWRDVLEGSGGDLARCGSTPLDAWAAGVLSALLNAPRERSEELRRELRKLGVAAFGLLAAA